VLGDGEQGRAGSDFEQGGGAFTQIRLGGMIAQGFQFGLLARG
jgi:hypothetical protein